MQHYSRFLGLDIIDRMSIGEISALRISNSLFHIVVTSDIVEGGLLCEIYHALRQTDLAQSLICVVPMVLWG